MSIRAYIAIGILIAIGGLFATQQVRIKAALRQATAAMQDAEQAKARAAMLATELDFAHLTQRVVIQYVDRVRIVREHSQAIIQEVPTHVTANADAQCTLPVGFVRVHDAAAQDRVPGPAYPGSADAPAAGLALSAVAATVAGNYGTCHETAQQLIALQAWVRETIAAIEAHNP